MIFAVFILFVALSISAVAAYYSIAGLTAIFAAAVYPIIVMGAVLEVGKIVATVWLHKYWNKASIQFKLYLIPAIITLMVFTSMGIFGYLSKAHLDQSLPAGDVVAQVQIYDEKIKTERDNIEAAKKALQQMDSQVDQMLSRTTDDTGANRAVKIRKQQAQERKSLQDDISASQKVIAQLQTERSPIAAQVRKVEAEVGPIKYIAALIYGDNPDSNLLERAVRWVIIMIIFVFDPLAIVLIVAADQTMEWQKTETEPAPKVEKRIPTRKKPEFFNLVDIGVPSVVDRAVKSTEQDMLEDTIEFPDPEIEVEPENSELSETRIKEIIEDLLAKKIEFKSLDKVTQDTILKHTNYTEKRRLFE